MPKAITSLEGYIRKLAKLDESHAGAQLLFRGHSSITYQISPSVFRSKNHTSSEHLMIRQLIAQHPAEFSNDKGIFDQLVRAQHYGLPTRLLDVSLNPLVALYFAVCSKPAARAAVIVFKPAVGTQKYYDSDIVSCLSCLALLTDGEKTSLLDKTRKYFKKIDSSTKLLGDKDLSEYNSEAEVFKLLQMVRQEKPYFLPILQPMDLARPIAVTPRKLHNRILAQNGAFVLFGLAKIPNAANMGHIKVETIDIDQASKARFKRELSYVGISESSLFPEIEKSALAIKARYE